MSGPYRRLPFVTPAEPTFCVKCRWVDVAREQCDHPNEWGALDYFSGQRCHKGTTCGKKNREGACPDFEQRRSWRLWLADLLRRVPW